ncbi:hypothetical protein BH18ACT13_BH18ACT13_10060 [soil metagenome]
MTDTASPSLIDATQHLSEGMKGIMASFSAAADASGQSSSDRYRFAGAPVVLHFAGRDLREALSPAFAHLATSSDGSADPVLTIRLWDSASTGSPPPPRPTIPEEFASGAMFHFHEGPLRAVYEPGTEALSVLDSGSGVAWYWVSDASKIPYWDRASPMRQMLFWWLQSRGYLQVHGSSVGTSDGGVLLVGRRGSGKSVTSLSSLGSPLLFAADDYVAVSVDAPPRIVSIYSSGKLVPEQGEKLLPHLMPLASNPDRLDTEKAVIFAHQHFPSQTTAGFPLRAILVPEVRAQQRESRIFDIPRTAAFAALAPSTIVQLRTAEQEALSVMSELVRRVPSFGIELGDDTAAIPGTIADFLARHAPAA